MAKFTRIVNGVLRSFNESGASLPTIYDDHLTVVSGAPANSQEMTGPVPASTSITLPNSGSYTSSDLQIELNGEAMELGYDWNLVGGSPPRTAISFTFDLVVGDRLHFTKLRDY